MRAWRAVKVVVIKRAAYVRQVYANLVRAPGVKRKFYQRFAAVCRQHLVIGAGVFAAFAEDVYKRQPYYCMEMNSFLTELGMVPQIIQTGRYSEEEAHYAKEIIKTCDPLVCKSANIAPLQYIYDELHPYLYLGHEFGARLRKKGIAIVHSDRAGSMLGFEVTEYLLKQLKAATAEAKIYRKEAGL